MSATEYYERYWTADGYNPLDGSGVPAEVEQIVRDRVAYGSRVLDVGCGNGRTGAALMLGRGVAYVGVDVSSTAVAAARDLGLDARVVDDASSLPFESGSFDFVLCTEVLEHLFRPDAAAAEIARVLRSGGTAVITLPNVAYWRRRTDLAIFGRWHPMGDDRSVEAPWRDPHIRFFQLSALRRMLQQCGLNAVEVRGHGGGFVREVPGLRRLGRGNVSHAYRRLECVAPSLFGSRLHAVAIRRG